MKTERNLKHGYTGKFPIIKEGGPNYVSKERKCKLFTVHKNNVTRLQVGDRVWINRMIIELLWKYKYIIRTTNVYFFAKYPR